MFGKKTRSTPKVRAKSSNSGLNRNKPKTKPAKPQAVTKAKPVKAKKPPKQVVKKAAKLPKVKTQSAKAAQPLQKPISRKATGVAVATSASGQRNIKKRVAKPAKPVNPSRTATGKVPQGRTLSTLDKFLDKKAKEPNKKRPVVVIESNEHNHLAVVQLSGRAGKDRTRLKNYQQGQSYFKHYVEIEDNEGKPIRVNDKFKENHPNMDVSEHDVNLIRDKVLDHSKASSENQKKMDILQKKE